MRCARATTEKTADHSTRQPRAGGFLSQPGLANLRPHRGTAQAMFIFFSNKLGCLGSILVSLLGTGLVLLLIFAL